MTLIENGTRFRALPLHDGILVEVRLDWKARTCTADILAFVTATQAAVPRLLIWHGVREARVPHHEPWGPSFYINTAHFEAPDLYTVEMQSGDEITVTAESFEFVTPPA